MQKVTVNGRPGHVTSVISAAAQRDKKCQVWFEGSAKPEFVDMKELEFERQEKVRAYVTLEDLQ